MQKYQSLASMPWGFRIILLSGITESFCFWVGLLIRLEYIESLKRCVAWVQEDIKKFQYYMDLPVNQGIRALKAEQKSREKFVAKTQKELNLWEPAFEWVVELR